MTPEEIKAHAETERYVLIMQAADQHHKNVAFEMSRFAEELRHISDVYGLRIGES
jgi:hypothetical protein